MSMISTVSPAEELRQRLMERQRAEGISYGEMARRLGVSRVYWNHVAIGRKPLHLAIAQGVALSWHYQDLAPLAQRVFLSLNVSKGPNMVPVEPKSQARKRRAAS